MAQSTDYVSNLDRHVQLLESKVNQLRASLTHWQQWYLEYSALKEEVEHLPNDPPPNEQLRRIRRDFDNKVLSKKEINEIMGKNDLKSPEQIVSVLSRRMDYVERNIDTLTKALENEENRLAAANVVAQPDAATDEESGLPITDIIEELDEDDNVVNFRLQGGADVEPKIVEALKKVGINEKNLPETGETPASSPGHKEAEKDSSPSLAATESGPREITPRGEPSGRKKSVSFAEDTKAGHNVAEPRSAQAAQGVVGRLMQQVRAMEAIDLSSAVIPENESAEDSQLRRQMLEYSMSEIGPVVAELQLEEDYSDDEDGMDWAGIDDEYEDELTDDDGEDELGRSKRSVVTSDYIKRMQELEKRLNVQSAFTVGSSETKPRKLDEGVGRIAVVGESSPSTTPLTPAPREKKSVSFASKLDIAPESASQPSPDVKFEERKIAYVGDVVEKSTEDEALEEPEEPPKRVSRFKKERGAIATPSSSQTAALPLGPHQLPTNFVAAGISAPAEPTPPKHETLAHTVVERPAVPDPAEPDDMDDTILYQAAAVEYNRLRNQMIQKQGGFVQQDGAIDSETGLVPLDEELGGPKRLSKFKAARLAKLQ